MRQETGEALLGTNDPRKDTIGVIHVAPTDTRKSVLEAILTQEKLGRTQIVVDLPSGPNKSFQRPDDFDGLKNMRRKMQAQLVIVAPDGPGPATFARQRRFPVFASIDEYKQSLGAGSSPASSAKKGWGFGRKPRLQAMDNPEDASSKNKGGPAQPVPPPEKQPEKPASHNAAIGAAGLGAGAGLAAGLAMGHHEASPPASPPALTHEQHDWDVLPPASGGPSTQNGQSGQGSQHPSDAIEPPSANASPSANEAPPVPGIIAFPQTPRRTTVKLPAVPPDAPAGSRASKQKRNSGKTAAVVGVGAGAGAAAAGAMAASRTGKAVGAPRSNWRSAGAAGAAGGGAGTIGTTGTSGTPPIKPRRRRRRALWLLLLLLLLLLVCGGIAYAYPATIAPLKGVVPSNLTGNPSATITITPKSADYPNTYVILGVTGTPSGQRQVQAHTLNSNTPSQSKTVPATGVKQTPGTAASGTLNFTNGTGSAFTVRAGEQFGTGVIVATNGPVTIPPGNGVSYGHASVSAHAVNVGSAGNIGSGVISGNCCSPSNAIFVNNSTFSGGSDPQNYTYVQQSDIDGAANPLIGPLTQSATNSVNSQKQAGEQFINKPQCNTSVTANNPAGTKASNVTVTVTAKCTGEVYDLKGAQSLATTALKSDATRKFGTNYLLAGTIATTITQATVIDKKGTIQLYVKAEGIWVYQFTDAAKQQLAKAIAGKKKADAMNILLQSAGVGKIDSINISNGSDTLPTDTKQITITIANVPGIPGGTPPVGNGTGTPIPPTATEPKGSVTPNGTSQPGGGS